MPVQFVDDLAQNWLTDLFDDPDDAWDLCLPFDIEVAKQLKAAQLPLTNGDVYQVCLGSELAPQCVGALMPKPDPAWTPYERCLHDRSASLLLASSIWGMWAQAQADPEDGSLADAIYPIAISAKKGKEGYLAHNLARCVDFGRLRPTKGGYLAAMQRTMGPVPWDETPAGKAYKGTQDSRGHYCSMKEDCVPEARARQALLTVACAMVAPEWMGELVEGFLRPFFAEVAEGRIVLPNGELPQGFVVEEEEPEPAPSCADYPLFRGGTGGPSISLDEMGRVPAPKAPEPEPVALPVEAEVVSVEPPATQEPDLFLEEPEDAFDTGDPWDGPFEEPEPEPTIRPRPRRRGRIRRHDED